MKMAMFDLLPLLIFLPYTIGTESFSERCGNLTRVAINCQSFAECSNGKWSVSRCPNGTKFDSERGQCADGVKCRRKRDFLDNPFLNHGNFVGHSSSNVNFHSSWSSLNGGENNHFHFPQEPMQWRPTRRTSSVNKIGVRIQTVSNGGSEESTIWYYESSGQSFKFTIAGGPPVPQDQLIQWVQQNHHRFAKTPIQYQEVVPGREEIKKDFLSETKIGPEGTFTTIWYYNSKGPNFKFTIKGPRPAPTDQMINWVEQNSGRYQTIPVPYMGDSDGVPSPPRVTPPPVHNYPVTQAATRPPPPPPTQFTYPTRKPYVTHKPPPKMTPRPQNNHPTILTSWKEIVPNACGLTSVNKIVGGAEVPIGVVPWQVGIVKQPSGQLLCGGSIITRWHVLSASHCFVTTQVTFDGKNKRTENKKITSEGDLLIHAGDEKLLQPLHKYEVLQLFTHNKYQPSHKRNDIALILIQGEFEFSATVVAICLPTTDVKKYEYKEGKHCRVSGWGRTIEQDASSTQDNLFMANLSIVNDMQCRVQHAVLVTEGMFCAGDYEKGGVDTCNGDSGGPCACDVTINRQARAVLFGVTSWGIGCGQKNKPGVYTRVFKFVAWIRHYLEVSMGGTNKAPTDWEDEDVGKPEEDEEEEDDTGDFDPDADVH